MRQKTPVEKTLNIKVGQRMRILQDIDYGVELKNVISENTGSRVM